MLDILSRNEQWIAKYILNHRGATSRLKLMQAMRKMHALSFFMLFLLGMLFRQLQQVARCHCQLTR